MSRRNAVALYDALASLPDCPEVRVVMTGNLAEDPRAWSEAGHITTKRRREAIKARFVDPDDGFGLGHNPDLHQLGVREVVWVMKGMMGRVISGGVTSASRSAGGGCLDKWWRWFRM